MDRPKVHECHMGCRTTRPRGRTVSITVRSALTTAYDNIHGKHLGSDRYLWGSLLWLLLYKILDGTPTNNCACVWSLIQEEYGLRSYHRRRKARYTYFKISLVCNPAKPYSSQPQLKGEASMIKHIGPILLDIWNKLMDDDDQVSVIIPFYHILFTHTPPSLYHMFCIPTTCTTHLMHTS